MDRAAVVLQARMGSTRFPGKSLARINGRSLLARAVERLQVSGLPVVVATTTDAEDDAIESAACQAGAEVTRGSASDVLGRFEAAALANDPVDHVVRLTGDCPLIDPEVIDRLIELHVDGGFDYSSNVRVLTFPDGLDCEVMTRRALREMAAEAREPYEREHVTAFIYRRPERFKLGSLVNDVVLGHLRWTVDTPADFKMVEAVFGALMPRNPAFGFADTLAFLDAHPDIAAINKP